MTSQSFGQDEPALRRLNGVSPRWSLWQPGNRQLFAYLLLLPAVLLTAAIIVYPILSAIDLSFQRIKIAKLGRERAPLTLRNYEELFQSPEFFQAIWVTISLVATVTLLSYVIGLATAVMVNQQFRGRKLARILVAVPWAVPSVMAAIIWWWLFDSSFGLINWALVRSGLSGEMIPWLSTPGAATFVIVIVMVWKGYPFISVIMLAGLQSIPLELYDAAKVDGASAWGRFRFITLPGLRSVRGIALILIMLWVFRDFPIIYLLTGGGPQGTTQTLAIMTYQEAFKFHDFGYAAAIGVITLIISVVASWFMVRRSDEPLF